MKKTITLLVALCMSLTLFAFSANESDYIFYVENDYQKDFDYLSSSLDNAKTNDEKAEILWRLSRTKLTLTDENQESMSKEELLSSYGDYSSSDKPKSDDKSSAFYYAYSSLELKQTANAYHWLASAVGRCGQVHGALNSLSKASGMKKLEDKALEDFGKFNLETDSWYVLSILYRSLPGSPISFGNSNYAISYIRKCIMTQDNANRTNGTNYLECAEQLYKRDWSQSKRSKEFAKMLKSYEKATEKGEGATEINKYYEGYLSSMGNPFYVAASLSSISDRQEAISMLDYASRLIEARLKNAKTEYSKNKMLEEKERIDSTLKEWR